LIACRCTAPNCLSPDRRSAGSQERCGLAERAGIRFAFIEYMKIAYPVMLITVALSMIYLELRYL